ncbi:hypothetical protein GH714_024653 [Hevea brasiliensis]|uniref:mitogen-activated protein kinase kinase n=1 Tax=Hevea brasiliensis TaxID=3981 RepID=A0A6A6M445_HEVBR|nr:hypothetical protein GH714_024653 [Hevea brasiliensis]
MVLARQKLQRNLQLLLPALQIGRCSPTPCFPKPVSNITIQGVGDFYDLEKLCVLGHGNHGIVYKVLHKPSSATYALKIVQDDITNSSASHETEILACTDSPFVVKCHGIFEPRAGEKAILMEHMDAGTLDTVLRANGPFHETLIAHIAYQALNGLSYLHACSIVHLDIKPSNLLVSKDMKVKIGDFGVSRIVDSGMTSHDNLGSQGTYAYMSPERLDSQTFGSMYIYAGDVWSLGVTLWELYVGYFPFFPAGKRPSWMEVAMVICFGEFPSFPKQASQEFRSFLKCCLEREPSKRWTVSQLLSHPFVRMQGEPNRLLPFAQISL